jgi:hypothetical protein
MKLAQTLTVALILVPAAALVLAAGCSTPAARPVAVAVPAPPPPPANQFVDSAACAPCHGREFKSHRHSFHAATAHLVSDLGKIAFPDGDLLGSSCRLRPSGSAFTISVGDSPVGAETLQFGLGSGKTGITFVSINDRTSLFEMRASYFPKIRQWYVTPGQKKMEPDEMGFDYPPARSRMCMGCHTTTLPEYSIVPDRRFLGVGCEACHGPGANHIAAIKRNDSAHLGMDRLGTLGGEQLNMLCGRCHRTTQDVMDRSPALATETQRFQTYGIMMSRCFTEGGKKLSCLNCHDPHTNASLDMRHYESACLSCHGGASGQAANSRTVARGKRCPVNPASGCIPCHMPARKIIPNADRSPSAVDHYIHVPPKGSAPAPYHSL